ncbi:uncharacterized protein LOC9630964 [Selaginella moellendorffii]|uniref:uncharacterized protein LOC9630964 n=1 Tax=Selaginella moellendorffii TaxID=88036 RepID=UPI000D1C4CF3|nr:uncharacterized protein LOC9630964 [Selaginella moellendorffii]|eukprot:XP_024528340.1 uncharacterized protein LOC9630964 [Selaginella moellendorffii]
MKIVARQAWAHLRRRASMIVSSRSLIGVPSRNFANGCVHRKLYEQVFPLGRLHHLLWNCRGIHSAAINHATGGTITRLSWEMWYRPFQVLYRAFIIMAEVVLLSIWHATERDVKKRAERLRRSLIRLGPFYIKLGQALSTRPDILPSVYCHELSKLQDQIPPFPSSKALKFIEKELGARTSEVFAEISKEPLAAASLGQVYKAKLFSGETVAVKVLRPGVPARLALDARLLNLVGGQLQRFTRARGDVAAVVNEMVAHMLEETDYLNEAKNTERFASLYGIEHPDEGLLTGKRRSKKGLVKVPKIFWRYTTKGVLTMEWIDGIKLTDREKLEKLNLDVQDLVDQGVFCSLRQLLEDGFFHADPHPGNLVVTHKGILAYFDFGMMSDFPRHYRIGLIRTLVHFVNRDSEGLAQDFLSLGFTPHGSDLKPIVHALRKSFGDEKTKAQLDFQGIMSQLSDVMYEFNFRLPPEFGLVIRALGSLEGTATTLDPEFRVIESAYPFIVGRLLSDPEPDMRQILLELLIRTNGTIRWHRLERLVVAISQDSTPTKQSRLQSFDMRAVASAADDLLAYILSDKGIRVRILLVKDIVKALNALIKESILEFYGLENQRSNVVEEAPDQDVQQAPEQEVQQVEKTTFFSRMRRFPWIQGQKVQARYKSAAPGGRPRSTRANPEQGKSSTTVEGKNLKSRVQGGIHAFWEAVNTAPEVWIPLLLKVAANREAQKLFVTILRATLESYNDQTSEAGFLFLSKKLHEDDK